MRFYIVTDLEGVEGVVLPVQTESGNPMYERARRLLTREVNIAVQTLNELGVEEIIVLDGHGANQAYNLVYEELVDGAKYIMGSPWPNYLPMLTSDFDGLMLIGAHAMAGAKGSVLDHTMSSMIWRGAYINDIPVGEIGICAFYAGSLGVPLIFVSGDDKACLEAKSLVNDVETAITKYGLTRTSAIMLPQATVEGNIKSALKKAVERCKDIKPLRIDGPVSFKIEFLLAGHAQRYWNKEDVKLLDARTVAFTGKDARDAIERWLSA
ncbi:MAG: M55 family metallopeptidase [bacterium]|nr:M55 family metallopeptidase [bacterium]